MDFAEESLTPSAKQKREGYVVTCFWVIGGVLFVLAIIAFFFYGGRASGRRAESTAMALMLIVGATMAPFIGVWMIIRGRRGMRRLKTFASWPVVTGVVETHLPLELVDVYDDNQQLTNKILRTGFTYNYAVNGKTYRNQITGEELCEPDVNAKEGLEAFRADFPIGHELEISVDPRDASHGTLDGVMRYSEAEGDGCLGGILIAIGILVYGGLLYFLAG